MTFLKFRAYDNFNGCYYHSENYKNLAEFFTECQKYIDGGNDLKFEQFTGKQDGNKKDVYEGSSFVQ